MDYLKLWNEFCFKVEKNRGKQEAVFQEAIENMFEKLGWSAFDGEIISHETVKIGTSQRAIPDILIKHDGKYQFAVELKTATSCLDKNYEMQLKSYMRQFKLQYGVLLGRTLKVFCDTDEFKQVTEITFDRDNPDGISFVETFCKQKYSFENLQTYCETKIKESRVTTGKPDYPGTTPKPPKEKGFIEYGETFTATVREICGVLFNKSVGSGGSYYEIRPNTFVWCIKFNETNDGWCNRLQDDFSIFQTQQYHEKFDMREKAEYNNIRYVFEKQKTSPVSHKFIGVYGKIIVDRKNRTTTLQRLSDKLDLASFNRFGC